MHRFSTLGVTAFQASEESATTNTLKYSPLTELEAIYTGRPLNHPHRFDTYLASFFDFTLCLQSPLPNTFSARGTTRAHSTDLVPLADGELGKV